MIPLPFHPSGMASAGIPRFWLNLVAPTAATPWALGSRPAPARWANPSAMRTRAAAAARSGDPLSASAISADSCGSP